MGIARIGRCGYFSPCLTAVRRLVCESVRKAKAVLLGEELDAIECVTPVEIGLKLVPPSAVRSSRLGLSAAVCASA